MHASAAPCLPEPLPARTPPSACLVWPGPNRLTSRSAMSTAAWKSGARYLRVTARASREGEGRQEEGCQSRREHAGGQAPAEGGQALGHEPMSGLVLGPGQTACREGEPPGRRPRGMACRRLPVTLRPAVPHDMGPGVWQPHAVHDGQRRGAAKHSVEPRARQPRAVRAVLRRAPAPDPLTWPARGTASPQTWALPCRSRPPRPPAPWPRRAPAAAAGRVGWLGGYAAGRVGGVGDWAGYGWLGGASGSTEGASEGCGVSRSGQGAVCGRCHWTHPPDAAPAPGS